MEEHENGRVLSWLDGPRLVVGAFAFFLCGLTILGILLWSDQQEQVERIDQIVEQQRQEARAADAQTVSRCFASATQGPALRRVLFALEREATDALAKRDLREFRRLNALTTPTLRECHALANRLNIPPPQGAGG